MEASLRDVGHIAINSHFITWFPYLITESPYFMCLRWGYLGTRRQCNLKHKAGLKIRQFFWDINISFLSVISESLQIVNVNLKLIFFQIQFLWKSYFCVYFSQIPLYSFYVYLILAMYFSRIYNKFYLVTKVSWHLSSV